LKIIINCYAQEKSTSFGENNSRLFYATIAVMNLAQDYRAASIKIADNLKTVPHTVSISEVSQLTLPEIDQITDLVGRIIPANVTALHAIGQKTLMNQMEQEFLEAYSHGLNHYIQELRQITISSRETQLEA